ncbi:hypothetical protein [Acetobacter fallax]|uniref:Uncharacterized protein n=1 Tax=Acetobacter fallax TaxID=1737473 RepID=A0ABX0K4M3_9PROT|nr:hypothetical protein [Acetobacter fallax]NHO31276.1 hypothetical protein [Acetobacter fallax]NHO34833.1 hypothetical protein [Acetobacter fallax]
MRILKLAAIAGITATLVSPAFAQPTADPHSSPAPTADSAAKQVGKSPKSATWQGKKVPPSKRLPSSEQVKREQPGTIPPTPGGTATPVTKPDTTRTDMPPMKSPSQMTPD